MTPDIRVQSEVFYLDAECERLAQTGPGAIATFTGIVRGDDGLTVLELEHYPGMTEKALDSIANQAGQRWSLFGLTVVHRIGKMVPGEAIVFVGASSRHRGDAIDAMHFVIDWLKTDAPFWKRETFADGRTAWVEARDGDDQQRQRWSD